MMLAHLVKVIGHNFTRQGRHIHVFGQYFNLCQHGFGWVGRTDAYRVTAFELFNQIYYF